MFRITQRGEVALFFAKIYNYCHASKSKRVFYCIFATQIVTGMKITLLVVGRTVDNNIIAGIKDYTQRLSHFAQFDIEVIPELKNAKKLSEAQQKEAEGELILKALQAGDRVVLLDEGGKEFRSTEFAAWIEHKQNISTKRLVFIVGGPYGFAPKVYEAAHEKLSLSKMTFSHQMIRLLFVEQLYRAYTIINHLPYHHN